MFCEVLIAAVIAMVIAFGISGGIVHEAGDYIVSAAVDQDDEQEQSAAEESDNGMRKDEIENSGASISLDAAGILLLFGLLLIPASVITAELPVLQKEPNENLKSIS